MMQHEGSEFASGPQLAKRLGIDAAQVRKDLGLTGISGQVGVGYDIDLLRHHIIGFLGWQRSWSAVLVGVGRLGRAVVSFEPLRDVNFHITCAFDRDPQRLGQCGDCPVYPVEEMERRVVISQARIGILAVPADAAQSIADRLFRAGMPAVWNLTPARVLAPPGCMVQNTNLIACLAVITRRLHTNDLPVCHELDF